MRSSTGRIHATEIGEQIGTPGGEGFADRGPVVHHALTEHQHGTFQPI
jgi:hypothetical protein